MPITLPILNRRLTWPQTLQFFALLARVRWLDRRMYASHRLVDRLGEDVAGDELLKLAHRWLATHEAIGDLIGCPEPPQVRVILKIPLIRVQG